MKDNFVITIFLLIVQRTGSKTSINIKIKHTNGFFNNFM